MSDKKIHFVYHACGPQECDCNPICNQWASELAGTADREKYVTCKNCLRILNSRKKP